MITSTVVENSTVSRSSQFITSKINFEEHYTSFIKTNAKNHLIKEVNKYLTTEFPECNLTPEFLVNNCIKYNIDIVFVLSQGIVESHLGTKGRAKYTNSVWNVGSFDNGKIMYIYKTPDESIEPYLSLLKEKYLISIIKRGNKVDTIKRDVSYFFKKGYCNIIGKRFAANTRYEQNILTTMENINSKTNIALYQSILKMDNDKILESFLYTEK